MWSRTTVKVLPCAPHQILLAGVFFFGCNVDSTGAKPFQPSAVIDRIYSHHVKEYAALSPVVGGFEAMRDDLGVMQAGQPNYGPDQLREVAVPVWSVLGEHDEFIERNHAEYIARSIPGARFVLLPDVSHFAPLQRPAAFNAAMLAFLGHVWRTPGASAQEEDRFDNRSRYCR
jgi:pimeloyl-ACP methyl ester carboxylesterase